MPQPMSAATLAEAVVQYGRDAYQLTIADDGQHTSFVSIDLMGNVIECAIGKVRRQEHCQQAQRFSVLAAEGAWPLCSRPKRHSH
jgi:hypothetical protein